MRTPPRLLPPRRSLGALLALLATVPLLHCSGPPAVVSLRPIWGYEDGCLPATLSGHGFVREGFAVSVGGVDVPVTWPEAPLDDGFTVTLDALPPHAPGNVPVVVTNGGETLTYEPGFTYTACEPSPRVDYGYVTDAEGNPLDVAAIAGGDLLVVVGCGFDDATTVTIGGVDAPILERGCTTSLLVEVPPADAHGPAGVAITNGVGTNEDLLVEYGCGTATVDAIDPAVADAAGGTVLTVTGCGFVDDGLVATTAWLDAPAIAARRRGSDRRGPGVAWTVEEAPCADSSCCWRSLVAPRRPTCLPRCPAGSRSAARSSPKAKRSRSPATSRSSRRAT